MAWFNVKTVSGHERTVNVAGNAADAARKVSAEINSPAITVQPLKEVYMGGGYCVVPVGDPEAVAL